MRTQAYTVNIVVIEYSQRIVTMNNLLTKENKKMINLYKDYKKENWKNSAKYQSTSGTIKNDVVLKDINNISRCNILTNCLKGDK